jgi:hypothetical protein
MDRVALNETSKPDSRRGIDETLSANLVYQSDHEIGSTFQVVKQMVMIMVMV